MCGVDVAVLHIPRVTCQVMEMDCLVSVLIKSHTTKCNGARLLVKFLAVFYLFLLSSIF